MLLVESLKESIEFYEGIGFFTENIGGHIHVSHGGATFILHEAKQKVMLGQIRPQMMDFISMRFATQTRKD